MYACKHTNTLHSPAGYNPIQGVSPGDMMCTILYHLETYALFSTAAVIWRPVHYPLPSGDLGTNLYHLVSCALASTAFIWSTVHYPLLLPSSGDLCTILYCRASLCSPSPPGRDLKHERRRRTPGVLLGVCRKEAAIEEGFSPAR